MPTTFRLARQTAGRGRFAAVTVTVEPAERLEVVVTATARPGHAREAELGARSAAAGSGWRIGITEIRFSEADTNLGDVHEAAARAVWEAAGVTDRGYVGIHETELVESWVHGMIGARLSEIVEAWHWVDGRPKELLHLWLVLDGRPAQLHGREDACFVRPLDRPYAPYDMDEYGECRVGPSERLAALPGTDLTAGAVLGDDTCAGLRLRFGEREVTIAHPGDEWEIDLSGSW